jgi:hypothetical protein
LRTDHTISSRPISNGEGKIDIATANDQAATVSVLFGNVVREVERVSMRVVPTAFWKSLFCQSIPRFSGRRSQPAAKVDEQEDWRIRKALTPLDFWLQAV